MDTKRLNKQSVKPKVLIAVPAVDHRIHTRLATWLLQEVQYNQLAEVHPMFIDGLVPHDNARNTAINVLLGAPECTHILFVDSDVVPPTGALNHLLAHDKTIVSAACPHVKYEQEEGHIYSLSFLKVKGKYKIYEGRGFEKVDVANAACMLAKREAFETGLRFQFIYNKDGTIRVSEEFGFAEEATRKGIELWTDFDLVCDHHRRCSFKALWEAQKKCLKKYV